MRHVALSFSLAVLFLVSAAGAAWAQATGDIAGTIHDESGAVLTWRHHYGDADRHWRHPYHGLE